MPLIKGKSKKAFGENIAIEEKAGKPKKQALAIAFDVQRRSKAPKKMYDGGNTSDPSYGTPTPTPKPAPGTGSDAVIGMGPDKPGSTQYKNHMAVMQGAGYAKGGHVESEQEMHARHSKEREMHYAEGGEIEDTRPGMDQSAQPSTAPIDWESEAKRLHEELRQHKAATPSPTPMAYGGEAVREDEEPRMPKRKSDNERLPEDEYMAGHFAEGGEVDEEEHHHGSIVDAIMAKNKYKHLGEDVDLEENDEEGPATREETNFKAKDFDAEHGDEEYKGQPKDSNEDGDEREKESENKDDMIDIIRKKNKFGKK